MAKYQVRDSAGEVAFEIDAESVVTEDGRYTFYDHAKRVVGTWPQEPAISGAVDGLQAAGASAPVANFHIIRL